MRVVREYIAQYPDPISVQAGARVVVGADDPEFPGWRWCTGPDGRSGWVPEQLLDRTGQEASDAPGLHRPGVECAGRSGSDPAPRGQRMGVGEHCGRWSWVDSRILYGG